MKPVRNEVDNEIEGQVWFQVYERISGKIEGQARDEVTGATIVFVRFHVKYEARNLK